MSNIPDNEAHEDEGGENDSKNHKTPGDLIELYEVLEWNKAVEGTK